MLRFLRLPKIWIPLLLIALALIGSLAFLFLPRLIASTRAPCSKENLAGVIKTISPPSKAGSTHIGLVTPGNTRGDIDMVINVDSSVRLFLQRGTACSAVQQGSLSDLKIGQTIKIWSNSGIVITTYPGVLTDVTDVVILFSQA